MNHAKRRITALGIVSIALSFLAPCRGNAQTGSGTVSGTVADPRGGALQGAQVRLMPGGANTLTDATGSFTLINVSGGDYTLKVSYAGFADYSAKLDVTAGKVTRVSPVLQVAATSQNVDVTAGREGGEVEAINRTFTADNIINVLPADVITSLPNANVADAIGRLASVTLERDEGEGKYVQVRGTEPRLTNTTVDGVNIASAETVRQVKLDIIPADLVESVQINKTLQANMEGDGIGGSVDLRTKSAGERPTIYLDSTGGYTPIIGGRPVYQFDGTIGKRFLTDKKLGILGGGSYDWNGRGINDVEPGPVFLGGYDERDYQYYRSRVGFAGTIDYRFNDTSSIYLKGLYSLFHNYGNRWDYGFGTSFDANYQPVAGSGSVSFGAEIRRPIQDLGSVQLGGNHLIKNNALLHWDIESSVGRTRDKGYDDATFTNYNAYSFSLDNSNPLIPRLKEVTGANVYDPSQFYLTQLRVNNYYNPEVDLGLGGSLATNYTVGKHASTIEIGGRFRNVHKFANQDTEYFIPNAAIPALEANGDAGVPVTDPSLQLSNFNNGFTDPNYYNSNYTFGIGADYDKLKQVPASSVPMELQTSHNTNASGQNFNFDEKVSAGYVMDTVDINKFRIVAGVRFEVTNTVDNGTTVPGAPNVAKSGSYLTVLPSASIRYSFDSVSGLRLVYGRGLSRPDFASLVSFATIAPGAVRTTSSIGNPNLKAEHADNVDLLYERTLKGVGLLQAGGFYKSLTDPIIDLNTTLTQGNPPTQVIQTQAQNAGSAFDYGFEIAYQQHFSTLPGLLSGFGVSANYAYTSSRVTWPKQVVLPDGSLNIDRTDHPRLLRQAPHTWNLSPTYDKKRLSIRLGLSYNAANIFAYQYSDSGAGGPFDPTQGSGGGYKGPNGDQYLYAHLQADLQGSFGLGKGFTAVAYGLNLNNEVFGFYNGSTANDVQREFYKPTFGGGLRWSPTHESK